MMWWYTHVKKRISNIWFCSWWNVTLAEVDTNRWYNWCCSWRNESMINPQKSPHTATTNKPQQVLKTMGPTLSVCHTSVSLFKIIFCLYFAHLKIPLRSFYHMPKELFWPLGLVSIFSFCSQELEWWSAVSEKLMCDWCLTPPSCFDSLRLFVVPARTFLQLLPPGHKRNGVSWRMPRLGGTVINVWRHTPVDLGWWHRGPRPSCPPQRQQRPAEASTGEHPCAPHLSEPHNITLSIFKKGKYNCKYKYTKTESLTGEYCAPHLSDPHNNTLSIFKKVNTIAKNRKYNEIQIHKDFI